MRRPRQSKRISHSPRNEPTEALDASELLGLFIDTAGSPAGREVWDIVSELLTHDEELGREMLRLVQTMRDVGALDEDEAWYVLYWITDQMSFRWASADAELERMSAAMVDIERSHDLSDDESFYVDDAPADWIASTRSGRRSSRGSASGRWRVWCVPGRCTRIRESRMAAPPLSRGLGNKTSSRLIP